MMYSISLPKVEFIFVCAIFIYRKSSSPDIKNHYKRFRAHVQKSIRDAYWKHITNIFSFENDNPDPDCPRKNEKAKKFWSFVKSLKKDASGINTLRDQRTNGPVNAHLRSAAYTNKHV